MQRLAISLGIWQSCVYVARSERIFFCHRVYDANRDEVITERTTGVSQARKVTAPNAVIPVYHRDNTTCSQNLFERVNKYD